MLVRCLKQSPYLYRHSKSPAFYFRRKVPIALCSVFNKREIKFSLRTADRTTAILLHDKISTNLNIIFSAEDVFFMSDILKNFNFDKAKTFEASSIIKNADGSFEIQGYKSNPENHEKDLETLKLLGFGQEPTQPTNNKKDKESLRFSSIVEKYLKYAELNVKTEDQDKAIFQIFIELYDDIFIDEIDDLLMTKFVETVQYNIPINAKKYYPKMTAKQISKLNHNNKKMMSSHSVNKYLGRVGMLLKYAKNHGYITQNFAEGKRIKDSKKTREQRRIFTDFELNTLFKTTNLYSNNYINNNNKDLFFLNLIALFSGMRLGEICQLEPLDIRKENEVWIFDINDNKELKSCKTNGSKRFIPVHNELLKFGFIDFVNSRKNQEFLFKWKYHKKNGWSHYSSKDANNLIQSIANIKEQSFHCFRHNVADVLMKNRNITKEVQEAILGHSHESESYKRYGKGFALNELQDAVNAIQYKGLNLEHLYI